MITKLFKVILLFVVILVSVKADAQYLGWKIAAESPNADSAINLTLTTLKSLVNVGLGNGSVTSVNSSLGGFASSGAITTSGTIALTYSGVTGLAKATNSGGFSTATPGSDYSAGTSALGTGILKSTTTTGALTIAVASDFPILNQSTSGNAATATSATSATTATTAGNVSGTVAVGNGGSGTTTLSGLLKGNGTSAFTAAVAGTDYLAPFTSQLANSIFAAPNGAAGVPSFRAIVASDIPLLNQSTGGNAATATLASTVTTNANLTGSVVTSVGNATSITAASIANSMLANPTTSVNGVTLILGGTQAAAFTLQNVTTAGNATTVASTFSGGFTGSGANLLSGATSATGGLTITNNPFTLQTGAALVEIPATTVTTTGTIGASTVQMPLNITTNSTLTLTSGLALGSVMECIMIPTSVAQVVFISGGTDTFNGNSAYTLLAGSQNTTVKFYKYSATAWRVSTIQ